MTALIAAPTGTHMSIRSDLIASKFPRHDVRDHTLSLREARIVELDSGAGEEPIVGITYMSDSRSEEEVGAADLHRAFNAAASPESFFGGLNDTDPTAAQASLVLARGDYVGFLTRPRLSTDTYLARLIERGATYIKSAEPGLQGLLSPQRADHSTREELRAMLPHIAVPARATKAELISLVRAHQKPLHPYRHAGWFESGDVLLLRKDDGAFGYVLDRLVDAARNGTLAVGGVGTSPFAAGITLADSRDLGPLARDAITLTHRLHAERMAALAPVQEDLAASGLRWYHLGTPTATTIEGVSQVRYWLNSHTLTLDSGRRAQASGWFTLQDLRERAYLRDPQARS